MKKQSTDIITLDWLTRMKVCARGKTWFRHFCRDGDDVTNVIEKLSKDNKYLWVCWLAEHSRWSGTIRLFYEGGRLRWSEEYKNGRIEGVREGLTKEGQTYTKERYEYHKIPRKGKGGVIKMCDVLRRVIIGGAPGECLPLRSRSYQPGAVAVKGK